MPAEQHINGVFGRSRRIRRGAFRRHPMPLPSSSSIPLSAGGRTGPRWEREILPLVVTRFGPRARWALTSRAGEAAVLAERARRDGTEMVVAVGGDGTLHEVVNGLDGGGGRRGRAAAWNRAERNRLRFCPDDRGSQGRGARAGAADHTGLGRGGCVRDRLQRAGRAAAAALLDQHVWMRDRWGGGRERQPMVRAAPRIPGLPPCLACGCRAIPAGGRGRSRWTAPRRPPCASSPCSSAMASTAAAACGPGRGARIDDGRLRVVTVEAMHPARVLMNLHRLYTGRVEGVRGVHVHQAQPRRCPRRR